MACLQLFFVINHFSYMVAGIKGGSGDVSSGKLRIWILMQAIERPRPIFVTKSYDIYIEC